MQQAAEEPNVSLVRSRASLGDPAWRGTRTPSLPAPAGPSACSVAARCFCYVLLLRARQKFPLVETFMGEGLVQPLMSSSKREINHVCPQVRWCVGMCCYSGRLYTPRKNRPARGPCVSLWKC